MKKTGFHIKSYRLGNLIPLAMTLVSVYFWVSYFQFDLIYYLGLFVNLFGLALWWSAKLTLAENWGMAFGKPQVKKLVTQGIYSKIRHPLYWGINFSLIGLVLIYPKIWFGVITFFIVIYLLFRMDVEDRGLAEKYGKKYQEYRRKTLF